MDRRKFFKVAGGSAVATHVSVQALQQVLMAAAQGVFEKSWAQAAGIEPRNYLHMHLRGGWNRTVWDSFLTPQGDNFAKGTFKVNPFSVTTANVDSNGDHSFSYDSFKTSNGIYAPKMWSQDVFNSLGQAVSLEGLLPNMATLRGFSSGIDGHGQNEHLVNLPDSNSISLAGAVADKSNTPLSATGPFVPSHFRSATGKGLTSISITDGVNSLKSIFTPFDFSSTSLAPVTTKSVSYKDIMDDISNRVSSIVRGSGPRASLLRDNVNQVNRLMGGLTEDLDAVWASLILKYDYVIKKAVATHGVYSQGIPGLFDKPIISKGGNRYRINTVSVVTGQDIRLPFMNPLSPLDIASLAEYLAVMEFIVTRQVSKTFTTNLSSPLSNINYGACSCVRDGSAFTGTGGYSNDEHITGAAGSLMAHTLAYRGLSAGILELSEALKRSKLANGKNLWEETVVHVTGDFGRSPQSDSGGSEHGFKGHVTTIFSGAFNNGPVLTGNIIVDNSDPVSKLFRGTWGEAAKYNFGNGDVRPLTLKNMLASVAHVLRIDPNPWPFTNRVWALSGGTLRVVQKPVNMTLAENKAA